MKLEGENWWKSVFILVHGLELPWQQLQDAMEIKRLLDKCLEFLKSTKGFRNYKKSKSENRESVE